MICSVLKNHVRIRERSQLCSGTLIITWKFVYNVNNGNTKQCLLLTWVTVAVSVLLSNSVFTGKLAIFSTWSLGIFLQELNGKQHSVI